MRVLWTTNEDPLRKNSLVYLHSSMENLKSHGIEVQLECIGPLNTLSGFWRAVRHVRSISNSFDIIHSQYGSVCGFITSLSYNKNKFITLRGSDWANPQSGNWLNRSHDFVAMITTAISLRNYNKVITVSHRMARSIPRLCYAGPITVLPSAINIEKFQLMSRQYAREAIGEGDDQRLWVLFTTQSISNPVKRYELAWEAFNLANLRFGGQLRLKVLSDVPHSLVPYHVAACDVILCTSKSEGWPNSIKEAMACGVPFVSTDVSDLKQITLQVPQCSVRKSTPKDLADGLCEVLSKSKGRELDGPVIRRSVEYMGTVTSAAMLAKLYKNA